MHIYKYINTNKLEINDIYKCFNHHSLYNAYQNIYRDMHNIVYLMLANRKYD